MTRFLAGCGLIALAAAAYADEPADPLREALKARQQGQLDAALKHAIEAIRQKPIDEKGYLLRAQLYEARDKNAEALADLDRVVELTPKLADVYQERGCVRFKLGQFAGSVQDFDRFVELRPEAKLRHWQRGISCYYAGQYEAGRKQFAGEGEVEPDDVENEIWRFMCVAKADGVKKARENLGKFGGDIRIPMRQVYELLKGDVQPDAVLAAAKGNDVPATQRRQQLFYAHLYIAIYHDLLGETDKARKHAELAADDFRIGHYMGDVARVQRDVLRKHAMKQ